MFKRVMLLEPRLDFMLREGKAARFMPIFSSNASMGNGFLKYVVLLLIMNVYKSIIS